MAEAAEVAESINAESTQTPVTSALKYLGVLSLSRRITSGE